ncbi:3'-5' exonuclease [Mangrovibacterium lignilyticum]|uniref:3'-5' exonuclease n=1 Tax=Mangrovibacterium lignilyticum TaxID=2668052 RepID=UPI0013D5F3B8|nr:3'-5' exonuclease [Mangrovibacterium lignilyticum]
MNFVAIDFETAKDHHVCAVGIVTVENGMITDEYYSLIQPPENKYNWHNIQVHGITEKDTRYAPTFVQVYPEIKQRLSGKVVVAHNESFDRSALMKTMADFGLSYAELDIASRWECTMKLCKASNKYPSGKLNECCAVHGIKLNHHEALSDARACAELFLRR